MYRKCSKLLSLWSSQQCIKYRHLNKLLIKRFLPKPIYFISIHLCESQNINLIFDQCRRAVINEDVLMANGMLCMYTKHFLLIYFAWLYHAGDIPEKFVLSFVWKLQAELQRTPHVKLHLTTLSNVIIIRCIVTLKLIRFEW